MGKMPNNFRLGRRGKRIPAPGTGMIRQVKFSKKSGVAPVVERYVTSGYVVQGYVEERTT